MHFLFPALCKKEYYSYPLSAGKNNIPAHRLAYDVTGRMQILIAVLKLIYNITVQISINRTNLLAVGG
jgi:hypothetical protein